MKKLLNFFLPGLFLLGLFVAKSAFAQTPSDGIDVTVSPTSFDFTNIPGSSIQSKFRIRNNTDTSVPFTISIGKLLPNGQYNDVSPADIDPKDEFIHWIHFDQASISARPKEWTDVKFSINIPSTAAFGYYYAIRIKQSSSSTVQQTSGSKVLGEVLIPILLTVKKDGAIAEGHIISFIPQSYINEYVPINFTVAVKNVGNVHIIPHGNIFINTGSEKNMAVIDVNDTQGAILPQGKRVFTSSWDDGFFVQEPVLEDGVPKFDKNHNPVTKLVINWDKITSFRLGKYTANLLLVYDNGKKDVAMEAVTSFWIVPYKIIGGAIISIVIIILLIRFIIQLYIKQQLKKYRKENS